MAEVQRVPAQKQSWNIRIEEVPGYLVTLEEESQKFVIEKSNPAKTAERYASCYENFERIVLSLFHYLDISVQTDHGVQDGQCIDRGILEHLASPDNPLHHMLGQGPPYAFLKGASNFRHRWRNRPRKGTSMLQDAPSNSDIAEGFEVVRGPLNHALQAVKNDMAHRANGQSLWEILRKKEIVLAMKEQDVTDREGKLENWEEEKAPRRELKREREEIERALKAFHTEQAQYRYERNLDIADLESEREQLSAQRESNTEQLRLCYIERANDHEELEAEILKTQKAWSDLQAEAATERIKEREIFESEVLKTQQARVGLEVKVKSLHDMIVAYRISRMQQEPKEECETKRRSVEDDLTVMITKLLADLAQSEIKREELDMENQGLLSQIGQLKDQVHLNKKVESHVVPEPADKECISCDEEQDSLSESNEGDYSSDDLGEETDDGTRNNRGIDEMP